VVGVASVARVSGVGESSVSVSGVESVSISLSLGVGGPLGNVDNSGRVGDISASTSVSSSNGGDGSVGQTNGGQGSRGADLGVPGGDRGGDGVVVGERSSHGGDSRGSNGLNNGRGLNLHSLDSGRGGISGISQAVAVGTVGSIVVGSVVVGVASVARVSGVGESSVSVSGVESVSISLSLGVGGPLGNVDNSGRVGDISASTSVSSSNGGDGGVSESSDAQGSRGADMGVPGGQRGMVVGGIRITSVSVSAKTVSSVGSVVSQSVAIGAVESVSISLGGSGSHGGKTSDSQEFVHDDC